MSVFTQIGEEELVEYLDRFDIGRLISFTGVESGIENTNYFVRTEQAHCVLTLVEQFGFKNTRWFIELIEFIGARGFPVPRPIADRTGVLLSTLAERPAVLCPIMEGRPVETVNESIVHQLGRGIGLLHSMTRDYPSRHPAFRDIHWCRRHYRSIRDCLDAGERALIESELGVQLCAQADKLPSGVIHADIFRDNVFFLEGQLQGVIDFWHSGVDSFLYELAIACNDWCWDKTAYHIELVHALLDGYIQYRPMSEAENKQWGKALRRAALRFWLSRLGDSRQQRHGVLTHCKNPQEQYAILRWLIDNQIADLSDLVRPA